MSRIGTVAAASGILAGTLILVEVGYGALALVCWPILFGSCRFTGLGLLEEALAIVLILDSAVCLVGPKKIFYSTAVLAGLFAAVILAVNDLSATALLTIGLLAAVLVVSVLAARWEPKVSEQVNPMNLPVFG